MLKKYFEFEKLQTNFKTELLAGVTTFITMSYILILNPMILSKAGMPFEAALTATILAAFVGCMFMGFYAKRPFGIAPYMGENAFITYTIVLLMGFTWQQALGAIFLSGIFFFVLTIINVRPWLVNSIPSSLKLSFTAGLGLFLAFLGFTNSGIVKITADSSLKIGNLHDPHVLFALLGFFIMMILMSKNVKSAILIGILTTTIIGVIVGDVQFSSGIASFSIPSIAPVAGKIDLAGIMNLKGFTLIFTLLVLIFVDTMGTLIGVSYRAGFLDEKGNLPEIHKPMLVDALSTTFAALIGTTTTGVYAESATGVEAGGKTGFVAIVVGFLFLLGLFFSPLFGAIPSYAYSPALIIVGLLMITSLSKINFDDWTEYFPAICTVLLMVFSSNIGIGMAAGFIIYPLLKILNGRNKDNNAAIWVLFAMSVLFFTVYPY